MRIAYLITFIRATFWVTHSSSSAPILIVEAGYDEWVAGAFLSGVAGPPARRSARSQSLADTAGTRRVMTGGLRPDRDVAMVAARRDRGEPQGGGMLPSGHRRLPPGRRPVDVVGNIPFMRMVKPRERVAMATVFSTWREMSALLSPLLAVTRPRRSGLPFRGLLRPAGGPRPRSRAAAGSTIPAS